KFGNLEVKVHPAAKLFDIMPDAELDELAADIAENGLQVPLVFIATEPDGENALLDGRNRLAAIARIPDKKRREEIRANINLGRDRVLYDGTDPYGYVISANWHRRQLTPEQRAKVIRRIKDEQPRLSTRLLAVMARTSQSTVQRALAGGEPLGSPDA